jgi:hypothetical protein
VTPLHPPISAIDHHRPPASLDWPGQTRHPPALGTTVPTVHTHLLFAPPRHAQPPSLQQTEAVASKETCTRASQQAAQEIVLTFNSSPHYLTSLPCAAALTAAALVRHKAYPMQLPLRMIWQPHPWATQRHSATSTGMFLWLPPLAPPLPCLSTQRRATKFPLLCMLLRGKELAAVVGRLTVTTWYTSV